MAQEVSDGAQGSCAIGLTRGVRVCAPWARRWGHYRGNCFRGSARCWHTPTEGEYGVMWRRRTLPNGPYFSQGDQGRPREPALSGGGEDVSDEIASDGDRDVFREGFWADRGCSLQKP